MGCFSGIGYGVGGFYLISFCLFLTTSVLDSVFSSFGVFTKTLASVQFPTLLQSFVIDKIFFGLDITPASVHVIFLFILLIVCTGLGVVSLVLGPE